MNGSVGPGANKMNGSVGPGANTPESSGCCRSGVHSTVQCHSAHLVCRMQAAQAPADSSWGAPHAPAGGPPTHQEVHGALGVDVPERQRLLILVDDLQPGASDAADG